MSKKQTKKHTAPTLGAQYGAVGLDPRWAAILVREAKAASGDRRKS